MQFFTVTRLILLCCVVILLGIFIVLIKHYSGIVNSIIKKMKRTKLDSLFSFFFFPWLIYQMNFANFSFCPQTVWQVF